MKRLLSLVLALGMALALLPALSLADAQSEEPMELEFWHNSTDRLPDQESEVQRLLEEKFNIKITWMPRNASTWSETITVMLSSGDIPDWWNDLDFVTYDKLVEQGLCAEIPEETIARVMPRYYDWLQRYLGTEDTLRYHKRDGVNYSLPILWTLGVQGYQPVMREDWLNKLGLEIPTTLDELEVVLDAFTNGDPDGNGQDDTYGWSASSYTGFSMIFGAFDAYPEAFYERDGAIVNGTIQPGAKEALELLHRWYDAGYLDPEFAVNTGSNVKEKWLAEKFGLLQTFWYTAIPEKAFNDGFYHDKLLEKNPDAIVSIIPTIAGPDGYKGCLQQNPLVSSGMQFSADIDPLKMEKYMEVSEYTSFDEETSDLLNFGVEGVTFEYDDENFTNWLPPYDEETKRWEFGIGSLGSLPGCFNDYDYLSRYMTKPQYKELRLEAEAGGCGEYDLLSVYERPIYNEYADTLKQLTNKNYIDFITGDRSLDEFDDFVSEWLAAGGQEVLDEAQQVYYAE